MNVLADVYESTKGDVLNQDDFDLRRPIIEECHPTAEYAHVPVYIYSDHEGKRAPTSSGSYCIDPEGRVCLLTVAHAINRTEGANNYIRTYTGSHRFEAAAFGDLPTNSPNYLFDPVVIMPLFQNMELPDEIDNSSLPGLLPEDIPSPRPPRQRDLTAVEQHFVDLGIDPNNNVNPSQLPRMASQSELDNIHKAKIFFLNPREMNERIDLTLIDPDTLDVTLVVKQNGVTIEHPLNNTLVLTQDLSGDEITPPDEVQSGDSGAPIYAEFTDDCGVKTVFVIGVFSTGVVLERRVRTNILTISVPAITEGGSIVRNSASV